MKKNTLHILSSKGQVKSKKHFVIRIIILFHTQFFGENSGGSGPRRALNVLWFSAIIDNSAGSNARRDPASLGCNHAAWTLVMGFIPVYIATRICAPNLSWDILVTLLHHCS